MKDTFNSMARGNIARTKKNEECEKVEAGGKGKKMDARAMSVFLVLKNKRG